MAKIDLNEALKAKEAAQSKRNENEPMHLDDATRVKVVSPTRLVFKRFVRNRLAIVGVSILAVMFLLSFIGPFFSSYGEAQTFYKLVDEVTDYGVASERKDYTDYSLDKDWTADHGLFVAAIPGVISNMRADGLDVAIAENKGEYGVVDKLGEYTYLLSVFTGDPVATFGAHEVLVGSIVGDKLNYGNGVEAVDGLEAAVSGLGGKTGTLDFGGNHYVYKKGSNKIESKLYLVEDSGFQYSSDAIGEEFESTLTADTSNGEVNFVVEVGGVRYAVVPGDVSVYAVYSLESAKEVQLNSRLALDAFDMNDFYSDEFKLAALRNSYADSFTVDGTLYTRSVNESGDIIISKGDAPYVSMSTFVVRRSDGKDTIEYSLKCAIREKIYAMKAASEVNGVISHRLPDQDEEGRNKYDEDGNIIYNEDAELIFEYNKNSGVYNLNAERRVFRIDRYAPSSSEHILGTDGDGYDVCIRIMYGGRISLMVGFVVVLLETVLGVIMGGLAGFFGGWVDNLIMRLVDIFYCIPTMPIMIIVGALMDANRWDPVMRVFVMMAALGILGWAGIARLVRGQILSLREQEFMVAAEATGVRMRKRIFRHLVPNVMPQIIVVATSSLGGVIITESTLSFLGLGVKKPMATWGTMISATSSLLDIQQQALIWIPVGLLICLTVIAFNFVGDGLRDAFDPKSKA